MLHGHGAFYSSQHPPRLPELHHKHGARGLDPAARQHVVCFPYKCTSQGPTVYGQQCVNQFGFQAFIQATQAVMGPMYTCVANGAQGLSPSWILIAAVLLLAANA